MDKYYDDYEIDTSGALTKKITELYPSAEVYAVIIYDDFNKSKKVLGDVFHYVLNLGVDKLCANLDTPSAISETIGAVIPITQIAPRVLINRKSFRTGTQT